MKNDPLPEEELVATLPCPRCLQRLPGSKIQSKVTCEVHWDWEGQFLLTEPRRTVEHSWLTYSMCKARGAEGAGSWAV